MCVLQYNEDCFLHSQKKKLHQCFISRSVTIPYVVLNFTWTLQVPAQAYMGKTTVNKIFMFFFKNK